MPFIDLMTPTTEMVTPKIQRQLIDIPRAVDFPEFCCLGVSQKTSFPVTNRSAFSVACRFRLVQLLHNGSVVRLDQQSPFELKPKMSISAGSSDSLPVSPLWVESFVLSEKVECTKPDLFTHTVWVYFSIKFSAY